jgi:uncharacterized protein YcnI
MIHIAATRLTRGAAAAALAALIAAPAAGVNIPEGGAVAPDSVFVINFQVQEGCDGDPVDTLEVALPDSIENPVPEAVGGWDVTVEPAEGDDRDGEQTVVRWTGGSVPDGTFKEFGLRARFPDEPGATIAFPVVQRCGLTELSWTETDGEMAAPTVTLTERFGPRDLIDLRDSLVQLRDQLDELSAQVGSIDGENLRSRVAENEATVQDLTERLDQMIQDGQDQESEPEG